MQPAGDKAINNIGEADSRGEGGTWGAGVSREKLYLYLTRREQRKEAQSCSREATQKRGHRAMGLWQERPGREQAEGGNGGEGSQKEKQRRKIKSSFRL